MSWLTSAAAAQPLAELYQRQEALEAAHGASRETEALRELNRAIRDAERRFTRAIEENDHSKIRRELRAGLDISEQVSLLEDAASSASPATIRLLLGSLERGDELVGDNGSTIWMRVAEREDPDVARAFAQKLKPSNWSFEALELAIRYGAWKVLDEHYYPGRHSQVRALALGYPDLARELGLDAESTRGDVLDALSLTLRFGEPHQLWSLLDFAKESLQPEELTLVVTTLLQEEREEAARSLLQFGVPPSRHLMEILIAEDDLETALVILHEGHPVGELWRGAFRGGAENIFWGLFVERHPELEYIYQAEAMDPKLRALTWLDWGLDPFYLTLQKASRSPADRSVDPDLRDRRGKTGLLNAMLERRAKLSELYLDAGADPNLCSDEVCPIFFAAKYGNLAMIQALRRHGVEADPESASGKKAANIYWKRRKFRPFSFDRLPVGDPIGMSMKLPVSSFGDSCSIESSHLLCSIDEDFVVAGADPDEGEGVFIVRLAAEPDMLRKMSLIFKRTFGLDTQADEPRVTSSLRRGGEGEEDAWVVQFTGTRGYADCEVQVVGHALMAPEVHELARRIFHSVGTTGIVSLAPLVRALIIGACVVFLVLAVLFRRRLEA